MLNPDSIKIYGYNAYHIIASVLLLRFITIMILYSITFYNALHTVDEFMNVLLITITFWGGIYKLWIILPNFRKIWDYFNVTKSDILSYQRYDKEIFQNWSRLSMQLFSTFVIIILFGSLGWTLNPFIF